MIKRLAAAQCGQACLTVNLHPKYPGGGSASDTSSMPFDLTAIYLKWLIF